MHKKDLEEGKIVIYSDGGAKGNPGKGGYGAVLLFKNHRKELSEGFRLTTNNRMELLGVIKALESLKRDDIPIVVYSDSKYIVDAINKGWLKNWIRKNWKKGKNEEVKNIDLWKRVQKLLENRDIIFKWVKGHNGIEENERCDELANLAIKEKSDKIDEEYEKEEKRLF